MFQEAEFWVLVAFVIFVVAVFKPLRRVLLGALDARAERIKAELDEAARLREEAQATLSAYQRKQREALKEAEDILAHARDEAEMIRGKTAKDLEAALKRREKMALDRINQAESDAVQEVREIAADIAIAATKELLAENLDRARADKLIAEAIAELPKKLH